MRHREVRGGRPDALPPRRTIAHHVYRLAGDSAAGAPPAVDDRQFAAFRGLLRRARLQGRDINAWCLLPRRWHLVVPPSALPALSLPPGDAARRFVSVPIADERQLATTMLYVEAVPLRARLVDRAEGWRWSSLRERVGCGSGAIA